MDALTTLARLAESLGCDVAMLEAIAAGDVSAELVGDHPAGALVTLSTFADYVRLLEDVDAAGGPGPWSRERLAAMSIRRHATSSRACPERFTVYHLLDEGGRVLYVGSTRNLDRRLRAHRRRWPDAFAACTSTDHPTAAAMLAAEVAEIAEHQPPLNIAGIS